MNANKAFSRLVDWISDGICRNASSAESPLGQGVVSEIDALYSEIDRLKYENAALREAVRVLGERLYTVDRILEHLNEYGSDEDVPYRLVSDHNKAAKAVDANTLAAAAVRDAEKECGK